MKFNNFKINFNHQWGQNFWKKKLSILYKKKLKKELEIFKWLCSNKWIQGVIQVAHLVLYHQIVKCNKCSTWKRNLKYQKKRMMHWKIYWQVKMMKSKEFYSKKLHLLTYLRTICSRWPINWLEMFEVLDLKRNFHKCQMIYKICKNLLL